MSCPSWGALLRRELTGLVPLLALGCGPARVEPVASPAPSPAPGPPQAAVALFPVTPAELSVAGDSRYLETEIIPFGHGVLAARRWRGWEREFMPRCPVKGLDPERCEAMLVAPATSRTQEDAFPRWENAPLDAWSVPWPTARPWTHFSGARRGVHAFNPEDQEPGSLRFDLIDEKGALSRFEAGMTEHPERPFLGGALVETPGGKRVLGLRDLPDNEGYSLVFATIREGDGKARVTRPRSLQIWPMSRENSTARDARYVMSRGERVAYGPWQIVPEIDARGKAAYSLLFVWTEVIPPPRLAWSSIPDAPAPRPPPATRGAWQRTPPHLRRDSLGCQAPSRKLSEISARKQMHVMRLNLAGDTLEDSLLPFPAGFDPDTSPLPLVISRPEGLQIGSLLLDQRLQVATSSAPPLVPGPPPEPSLTQGIVQAAFDPPTREGLVIIQQGEKHLARRFDALGSPLGEVLEFTGDLLLRREVEVLGRGARGWVAMGGDEQRPSGWIYPIGPDRAPLVLPGAQAAGWSRWPTEGWGDGFIFKGLFKNARGELGVLAGNYENFLVALVDQDAGTVKNPAPFAGNAHLNQQLPGWFVGEHGAWFLDGMTLHDEAGPHPLPEEALSIAGPVARVSYHRVWNDIVMVRQGEHAISATWLRQGVTRRLDRAEAIRAGDHDRPPAAPRDRLGGFESPLLLGGRALLPSTPGDVIETPSLAPLWSDCPFIAQTTPDRLVLVCLDVVGTRAAGTSVVLRSFPIEPPAAPARP